MSRSKRRIDRDTFVPFSFEKGGRVDEADRWLDTLTAAEPAEQVASQDYSHANREPADSDDYRDRPEGGDAGAGAPAGPQAREAFGEDPLRFRGGTEEYRAVF
jgi:hypothetical protein